MQFHYNTVKDSIIDVKLDKRTECFNWGKDNAYPSMIKALIGMSVTAKTCVDKVAKAIYGKSFGEVGKVKINSKGQSLNELFRIATREYSEQNNVFLHIAYDGNLDIKSINLINSTDSRVGKADDKGYSGKYIIYNNRDKSQGRKIQSDKFRVVHKYNSDKAVIEEQIRHDAKQNKKKLTGEEPIEDLLPFYEGQILHIKKDHSLIYALSDLNPVLSEALLEGNSQTFRSRGSEKGFLNTKALVTQPMKDDNERKEFKKELNEVRGADNSSEVIHIEATQQADDLSKQIYIADLSSPYNDKLFEYSDKQAEKNICKAFGVPLILVSQNDNSIFGNSGELIVQAQIQMWNEKEEERDQLEEVVSELMQRFSSPIKEPLKVINPYQTITNG